MVPEQTEHLISLCYALFHASPDSQPPFSLEIGLEGGSKIELSGCLHIPDAILKMEEYRKSKALSYRENFTLLYPIYMDAMGTESESTMHSIAWLIKDEADAQKWNFDRIHGLTGKTTRDFWT